MLTSSTFSDAVSSSTHLVEFMAPWCAHCQALTPQFYDAAKQSGESVQFAIVNCDEEPQLCQQQGIKSFPTIKLYRPDRATPEDYAGERRADALVAYVQRLSGVYHVLIRSFAQLQEFTQQPLVVVGFFSHDRQQMYKEFVTQLKAWKGKIVAAVCFDAAITQQFGATVPSIHSFFQNYHAGHHTQMTLPSEAEAAALPNAMQKWFENQVFPPFAFIDPVTFPAFQLRDRPRLWVLCHLGSMDRERILGAQLAKALPDYSVVFADFEEQREFAERLGFTRETYSAPSFLIEDGPNFVFVYSAHNPEMKQLAPLAEWASSVRSGKIRTSVRSEPVPTPRQLEQHLESTGKLLLVGDTLDSYLEGDQDLIVEYTSHCIWCKLLKPRIAAVAKRMKKAAPDTAPLFGTFDVFHNEVRAPLPIEPDGLPCLVYYSPSTHTAYRWNNNYNEAKAEKSIQEWINTVRKETKAPPIKLK